MDQIRHLFSRVYGPNALPVPDIPLPALDTRMIFEPGIGFHLQAGESTFEGKFRFYYPIGEGQAAIEINHVFVEYYKTDTLLRDERFARSRNVEGFATADINIATYLTLVRNRRFPDVVLRINLRTASGTKLSDIRTTDSPGYFFDVIFGKAICKSNRINNFEWKLYGMSGLYVWQTSINDRRQNDAFLFGAGSQLKVAKHELSAEIAGYLGYHKMRDDPVAARLRYAYNRTNNSLQIQYQKGLHDIYHHSVHFTMAWIIQNRKGWGKIKVK